MTIHNKSEFVRGMVSLLIAIAGAVALFLKGISAKLLLSTTALFIFALYEIKGSFVDPKMFDLETIKERERENIIDMKCKSKTFQIMWWINVVISIILAIGIGVTKNENLIIAFVITSMYVSIQFVLELCTYLYYNKEMKKEEGINKL